MSTTMYLTPERLRSTSALNDLGPVHMDQAMLEPHCMWTLVLALGTVTAPPAKVRTFAMLRA